MQLLHPNDASIDFQYRNLIFLNVFYFFGQFSKSENDFNPARLVRQLKARSLTNILMRHIYKYSTDKCIYVLIIDISLII